MTGSERGTDRISTKVWYYAEMAHRREPCGRCGHKRGNHHYIRLVGDHSGGCGSKACPCDLFEEKRKK